METNRREKRRTARIAAHLLVASFLLALVVTTPASATPNATATRLHGPDRYATSRAIAETFPQHSGRNAVLVRGDEFADALAGAKRAGAGGATSGGGPVVLTSSMHLHDDALAALRAADVARVTIVGSEAAISREVEDRLKAEGFTVFRSEGADRYETAADVNHPTAYDDCECYPEDTAIVASGEVFADALAASPLSWREGFPILLTRKGDLPEVTRDLLARYVKRVYLVGGTAAVSFEVEDQIRHACRDAIGRPQECITVERIAGDDRAATAVKLAQLARLRGWDFTHVNLTRGDNFPDGLAGGAHGGMEMAPVLLTQSPTVLGAATRDFLRDHSGVVESIHVFGDATAVSDEVVAEAVSAARGT